MNKIDNTLMYYWNRKVTKKSRDKFIYYIIAFNAHSPYMHRWVTLACTCKKRTKIKCEKQKNSDFVRNFR